MGGDFADKMKALPIPIITNSECESWILKLLGPNFKVHSSQLCAGVEGSFESDTCTGDGGSPLVCNKKSDPNTFVQMGLVSARLSDAECGTSSIPGIYSNIADSMCMIKAIVQHVVGDRYAAYFENQICPEDYVDTYKAIIVKEKKIAEYTEKQEELATRLAKIEENINEVFVVEEPVEYYDSGCIDKDEYGNPCPDDYD